MKRLLLLSVSAVLLLGQTATVYVIQPHDTEALKAVYGQYVEAEKAWNAARLAAIRKYAPEGSCSSADSCPYAFSQDFRAIVPEQKAVYIGPSWSPGYPYGFGSTTLEHRP